MKIHYISLLGILIPLSLPAANVSHVELLLASLYIALSDNQPVPLVDVSSDDKPSSKKVYEKREQEKNKRFFIKQPKKHIRRTNFKNN